MILSPLFSASANHSAPLSAVLFFVALCGNTLAFAADPVSPDVAQSPAQQRIVELSASGNYQAAGTQGLEVLEREKTDTGLRLIVANSLAWSGRFKQAALQYKLLSNSKQRKEARVGLANVYRWKGRDDQALPLYQTVLAEDPQNAAALEGLGYAMRELNPRTLITVGAGQDSGDAKRREATISQRWRDDTGRHVFEIGTAGLRDQLPTTAVQQRDISVSYQNLNLPLEPRLELNAQAKPATDVFGNLKLKIDDGRFLLEVGRTNWGKSAFNARAVEDGLTAAHIGFDANLNFEVGQLSEHVDVFRISDNNVILTTRSNFIPSWRPFGHRIKPFAGIETRDVRFYSNRYWSPTDGFGTAYVGLSADWGSENWSLFGSGQVGTRLYGEAGSNWSLGVGGKRWLGKNLAIGVNLWSMASRRDNARYRAKSFSMNLEKLWD
ncbi:tetratricopeptide repeat protein [Undibacterium sp. Ji49W]|uniref:tetratricopeptide repeat protein n=1 Tax=Undibacterium sp. Ji49W TaxID=3413040 RepID=UPI003BF40A10